MSVQARSVEHMTTVEGERSGTPVPDRPCRVHWFAGRVNEVLDDLTTGGVRVAELTADETAEAISELCRAEPRIQALKLALLAHGDLVDVAERSAATSTAAWFASATRTVRGRAHGLVRLARQLDGGGSATTGAADAPAFRATAAALQDGSVDVDQAQVITESVTALPASVTIEDRERAEAHLLDEATRHDAKALKLLARHLLHVIDPEAADAELLTRLEREEAAAARRTTFKILDGGDGTCHGSFRIPSVHGAMLSVALDALASPKRPDAITREVTDEDGHVVQRTAPELLGLAFVELIERYPTKKLPQTGGGLASVLVTIPLEVLETGLGVAALSTGGHVTAGAARRLACHAGIIPQVLGSKSEVLDQGRRVRLHTPAQRMAMAARDKTCTITGCTIPAAWCHAHHRVPWSAGGRTSVADGRLVCPRHHRMIHLPRYDAEYLSSGGINLTRRRRH